LPKNAVFQRSYLPLVLALAEGIRKHHFLYYDVTLNEVKGLGVGEYAFIVCPSPRFFAALRMTLSDSNHSKYNTHLKCWKRFINLALILLLYHCGLFGFRLTDYGLIPDMS
tara:strand:- start:40 stop:372 length:333 start_codon:yes stop_codon:yes gene_type:complete